MDENVTWLRSSPHCRCQFRGLAAVIVCAAGVTCCTGRSECQRASSDSKISPEFASSDLLVSSSITKPIKITASDAVCVSGLLQNPPDARACYVLAHGAGAGMDQSLHGGRRRRTRPAWHRYFALPISLHGVRRQATRSAATGASSRPGGRDPWALLTVPVR